jgi:hypothetical protein
MQAVVTPFKPIPGSTVSISATSTSANVAIPDVAKLSTAMRVVIVSGTANARVRSGVGSSQAVAVAGDPLCLVGAVEVFGINAADTYVAAKTDAGACTVEFTFGFGS